MWMATRSAITGRFVAAAKAFTHPDTTVTEQRRVFTPQQVGAAWSLRSYLDGHADLHRADLEAVVAAVIGERE